MEFSQTESRILTALFKLDESLLNPQIRVCFVAVPGTSRNSNSDNRQPTGNRSPSNCCPKSMSSTRHSGILNGSELEETHHMAKRVQEEIPSCSPGTSSAKEKRARSTSQSHFRSKDSSATNKADPSTIGNEK